jgi:hypothetical protein
MADTIKSLRTNDQFIVDLARYADGTDTEAAIRKRWRLTEEEWVRLASDDELLRRQRIGLSKRELAQKYVVEGPRILSGIAQDPTASARHRVDAIRTLDSMSDTGPEAAPAGDRFQITIVLSADERITIDKPYAKTINSDANTQPRFNKSIKPDPRDVDDAIVDHSNDTDTAQQSFCFAAIAARRDGNEGGGAPR